ncbi:arabinogalactan oligomer / maltooligosaccharide transport system permease protein [Bowdeniella nasicola]|uniref:Maltose/maltodextrin transport system permease protein n=1 Tax=Bowdeniella nasicola TaxID=208480 RepID=A0A1H3W603_9ACTO|nr:ABC transporter permease subunit [Bowdeniella nasicola]SDZ82261.1 arabinogalactan oligomer / maltooligosaccharide transport system permease protein [Bowdeniella nasicola]
MSDHQSAADTKVAKNRAKAARESHATSIQPGFIAKLVVMAIINALGVYILLSAWQGGHTMITGIMLAILIVVNIIYFSKRMLPMKYLAPGLVFLLVYQIFVVLYTGYVAFTNYGDGHNSDKSDAISAILAQNQRRVESSAAMPLTVIDKDGELGFAVVQDGAVKVGTSEEPLADAPDAKVDGTKVTEVPGWQVLNFGDIAKRQTEITQLRVPVSDDPNQGSVGTSDGMTGYAYTPQMTYDEASDTLTDLASGKVYKPNNTGNFQAEDGTTISTGWRVPVGFDNFKEAFGDSRYAGPFVKVLLWTFAFALLSVATTFFLGLFFAIVMNDERMKGRKIYRTLMLLPYAFPAFLTALLFKGMLNRDFGFINQVLLGGVGVEWLNDPWLAKFAIIFVNLWMGFPYMFLICTGALQAIPDDVIEAAKIDGASPFRIFRSVTMPLLLVAVAPLLISSFAFNFNNFNLIYMLTGGGPRFTDTSAPIGATDILITMVYSVAGLDGGAAKNYGLASALSIVIFLIVATISLISFKKTKTLEEIN